MRDSARWRNWGRNQECSPAAVETPTSELEVVEAVQRAKRAGQTVKVVGEALAPAQLAEPSVVDAKVVPDLVDDGDPDLVGQVRLVL